jgi:hypothetical protein
MGYHKSESFIQSYTEYTKLIVHRSCIGDYELTDVCKKTRNKKGRNTYRQTLKDQS